MSRLNESEADWLREQAEAVRHLTRQTSAAVVRVGLILIEAKRRLGFRRFWAWVEAEFRWTRSTAHRMMQVARVFADVPGETLGRFCPSALYTLAKNHTPAGVRAEVIAAAAAGRSFNELEVKARIAATGAHSALRPERKTGKPAVRSEVAPANDPKAAAEAALVELTGAGAEVRFTLRRDAGARRVWVCQVSYGDDPPAEFTSTAGPLAALALAGSAPRWASERPPRSKQGQKERREAVERHLRANPLAKQAAVARALGVNERFVHRVREGMGGDFARPWDDVVRDRIKERLRADPSTANATLAEEYGCSPSLVGTTRKAMELFEGLPVVTARVDRNGVVMDVAPLAGAGDVEDLTSSLQGAA